MAAIIFLNGASSAGKTSLGKALQDVLNEPYVLLGLDTFFHTVPARWAGGPPGPIAILGSTTSIFHRRMATPFWALAMALWDGGSWWNFIVQPLS